MFVCREQVAYLGHVVSREGVATDSEKTTKVSNWQIPITVLEVQQFLGLASYYQCFVREITQELQAHYTQTDRARLTVCLVLKLKLIHALY